MSPIVKMIAVTLALTMLMLDLTSAQSTIDFKLTKTSCQQKTQVDQVLIDKARAGDYSSEDKKLYAYAFCIYRSLGVIDDSANLIVGALTSLAGEMVNKERLQKAIDTCSKGTGSDSNEKAFKLVKCFHDQFPEAECDL